MRVGRWCGSYQKTMMSDRNDEYFDGMIVPIKNTKGTMHREDKSWYGYMYVCGWVCLRSINE